MILPGLGHPLPRQSAFLGPTANVFAEYISGYTPDTDLIGYVGPTYFAYPQMGTLDVQPIPGLHLSRSLEIYTYGPNSWTGSIYFYGTENLGFLQQKAKYFRISLSPWLPCDWQIMEGHYCGLVYHVNMMNPNFTETLSFREKLP